MKKTLPLEDIKLYVGLLMEDISVKTMFLFEDNFSMKNKLNQSYMKSIEVQDQLRKLRASIYGLALKVAATNGIEIPELKKKPATKYRKPKGKKNGSRA